LARLENSLEFGSLALIWRFSMRKLLLAVGLVSLALPVTAQAHFNLTLPPSMAKSTEGGKGDAPCGPDTQDKAATATVTPVTGGQVLMLNIDETTPHPGFYRFAISTTTPPTFPADNAVCDSGKNIILPSSNALSAKGLISNPVRFPVIADGMFIHMEDNPPKQSFPNAGHTGQVIVPNLTCEKCTLQVIEYMNKHGSNGPSAGFFYHHCALLKITADPNKPLDPPAAAGAGGAPSCDAGAPGTAGAGMGGGGGSASGGTGGASGGTGGASGGTGGASAGAGGASAGAAGAAIAGAPNSAGATAAGASSAGASASPAGAPAVPGSDPGDNGGGCSLSHRAVGSLPALSLLLGLFALGRRRSRRG
jgi:hypothetical protein